MNDHATLTDAADAHTPAPTDVQIIDALVEAFDIDPLMIIARLICMDYVAVRREVRP